MFLAIHDFRLHNFHLHCKDRLKPPASTIPYIAVGSFVIAIVIFYRLKSKVKK